MKTHRVDDADHMVIDTRPRGGTVKEYRLRVVDLDGESRQIAGHHIRRLDLAEEADVVDARELVGDAWELKVGTGYCVSAGVEAKDWAARISASA